LLYSNRDENSITFKREFDRMNEVNDQLKVIYTVTGPEAMKKGCARGRTGLIDSCLIAEEIPDHTERVFFISGPPSMVMCLAGLLRTELNTPPDRIRTERFTGYG
ncbi:MAG: xylene monooxygenase, partial [Candidatus Omnitrophica bacterium]|nr:xylene monooxygenase [Candidatus Omnitrophota bacterium]